MTGTGTGMVMYPQPSAQCTVQIAACYFHPRHFWDHSGVMLVGCVWFMGQSRRVDRGGVVVGGDWKGMCNMAVPRSMNRTELQRKKQNAPRHTPHAARAALCGLTAHASCCWCTFYSHSQLRSCLLSAVCCLLWLCPPPPLPRRPLSHAARVG